MDQHSGANWQVVDHNLALQLSRTEMGTRTLVDQLAVRTRQNHQASHRFIQATKIVQHMDHQQRPIRAFVGLVIVMPWLALDPGTLPVAV